MFDHSQRILVTGLTAIHGWPVWKALRRILPDKNLMGICPPQTRVPIPGQVNPVCITDRNVLSQIRRRFKPTSVIHCAGVCDLDLCEERPQWAWNLNVNGMKAIAEVFGADSPIYYFSSDLVFSGLQPPAGGYHEDHPVDPVSVVGQTIVQAESVLSDIENYAIVRLGLPLGKSITGSAGAIDWIKGRLLKHRPVTLFHDEWRSCLWCEQIEALTTVLVQYPLRGLYHFGGNRLWALYEIGHYVLNQVDCPDHLLRGISRRDEQNGPPRVGNLALDSTRLKSKLNQLNRIITNFND